MKNKLLILLSLIFFSCGPEKSQDKISFKAAAPSAYRIDKATGDTFYVEKVTKTVSQTVTFSYQADSLIIKPFKGIVTPPVTPPSSGTYTFSSTSAPVNGAYGYGWENWQKSSPSLSVTTFGIYLRFQGYEFYADQNSDRVTLPARFIAAVNEAKSKGGKFSFGIMDFYPESSRKSIPQFALNKIDNYAYGNEGLANVNDPDLHAYYLKRNTDINSAIYAAGLQDYIDYIDIRGVGAWGEWNWSGVFDVVNSQMNASYRLTEASGKAIVNSYINGFPNFQLVALIGAHDGRGQYSLQNTSTPPGISDYLLTASNKFGRIGLRRDHTGSGYDFLNQYMSGNAGKIWPFAPIVGEPIGLGGPVTNMYNEIVSYHYNSIGNGNGAHLLSVAEGNRIGSAMGWRLTLKSGAIKDGIATINWISNGIVPMYEDWKIIYVVDGKEYPGASLRLKFGDFITTDNVSFSSGTVLIKLRAPGRQDVLLK